MGQTILYCRKCGAKLAPEQFKSGEAILLDGRPLCVGCVDTPVPAKPAPPSRRPSQAIPLHRPPAVRPPTSRRALPASSRLPGLIVLGGAVVGGLVAAWFFLGGRSEPPAPVRTVVKPKPEAPKETPAAPAPAPDKPEEPAPPAPPTAIENELAALEARRAEACTREEFAQAVAVLEEARNRRPDVPWVQAIEAKILQVRAAAAQLFGPLKEKAREARRRGAAEEVRAVVDRVSKWGLQDLSAELDRALEEVSPSRGPAAEARSGEAALYARRWEEAMYAAADRDYSAAIRALEEASQKLEDRKLQGEAAGDMEILRLVRGACEETNQLFSKSAKGQKVSLEVFDPDGRRRPVEGTVSRAGPGWVEVKGEKDAVVVDFGDLTGKTIAGLFRSRPDKRDGDARLMAIFLLLEGDPEGARAAGVEGIPEAFWNHAKRRATILPAPSAAEKGAREAFLAILGPQRDWPEGHRRGGTAARCRELLERHGNTAFARRHREAVGRLMEPAREYLFAAGDLKGSGTFRLAPQPRMGKVWTVGETALGIAAKDNYVEMEFDALPETNYRGWVYAGGCCAEVFVFYWQGTDLREALQKGGAPVEMEPGANASLPLRHSVAGLPRAHAGHPVTAEVVKWGWVPIPLPKYPAPGPKKVRVLGEFQGAAVAGGVISSARTAPPSEARLREIEKEEAPEAAGKGEKAPRTGIGAGLVAHWKFDEGSGTAGSDADGRGFAGTLQNGATWGPGRSGTALSFDGQDDFFEVSEAPELDPAQLTLAAWFCPEELRSSGNTRDWLVSKGRNEWTDGHYALALDTKERQPVAYLNIGGGKGDCVEVRGPANSVAAGGWYHIALTYDGSVLKLYFNGALAGAKAVNKPRTRGKGPLIMGKRGDDWSKFKGRIDDVWLYDRALPAAEIHAVIRAAASK